MYVYKYAAVVEGKRKGFVLVTPKPFSKQEIESTIKCEIVEWLEIKTTRIFTLS